MDKKIKRIGVLTGTISGQLAGALPNYRALA